MKPYFILKKHRCPGNRYSYDANSNLSYGPHKGLDITYNHLNVPIRVESEDCNRIEFTYSADGTQLQRSVYVGNALSSRRDYVNGVEYHNEVLEAVYHGQGRLYFEQEEAEY